MRKPSVALVLGVVVFVQLLAFPTASGADQWSASVTVPPGSDGISFVDNFQTGPVSYIAASTDSVSGAVPQIQCLTFTSPSNCDLNNAGTSGEVTAYLPVCATSSSTNCVASMSLGASVDSMVPSTFVAMTNGPTTPANPTLNLPAGSTEELWTNPLTNLGGANTYATVVETQFAIEDGKVVNADLEANIDPYHEISQNNPNPPFVTVNPQGQVVVEGGSTDCAYTYATLCGRLEDFPLGTQASLSIRVTKLVGGWFKGRLQDPTISEMPFDAKSNVISVSAGVVTVPTLAYVATSPQMESDLGPTVFSNMFPAPPIAAASYVPTDYNGDLIDDLRAAVNNTASGQITIWHFGTLQPWLSTSGESVSCLNQHNEVDGIVTTNSMTYQPGAPNLIGGAFDYSVAGMHYNADGSVALGTYDLTMRNSVATCLYGFTNAPISATVSVTEDSTGDQNVATTSVSDANGWIHVGAYGFNFSNPTITVKLTQPKPRVKKTTIVCVRKKSVRRISGAPPKCPAGFTKRR